MGPRRTRLLAGLLAVLTGLAANQALAQLNPLPELIPGCQKQIRHDLNRVLVETPLGTMTLQLFPSVAPVTVENFLGYIERGDYTDTIVHRVVPSEPGPEDDFVIQAGGFAQSGIRFGAIETQPAIPNDPCISNLVGTIAMAKTANDPNSATSQWFVNLKDNSFLDTENGGFTAFGRVLGDGLEVATAIVNLEDRPPRTPIPPYLADVLGSAWGILTGYPDFLPATGSPLQGPLVDPLVHGCFDVAQSGLVLAEDPVDQFDWQPGTVEDDLLFSLVSTACAGAGTGGSPGFACNPPGRRILLIDPNTGAFIPDGDAPFGFAESLLSCEDIAASDAAFTQRLEDLGAQFDVQLVKTVYTVPEPGAVLLGTVSLLCLGALASARRRRACAGSRG